MVYSNGKREREQVSQWVRIKLYGEEFNFNFYIYGFDF